MGATDVLFVSLDSCRYDTFLVAHRQGGLPHLSSIGPLHRAQAPSYFTYGSHAAFWMGFSRGRRCPEPSLIKQASCSAWLFLAIPVRTATRASVLKVATSLRASDGRATAQSAVALSTGSTPPAKLGPFLPSLSSIFFAGNTWSLGVQLHWIEQRLAQVPESQPRFVFLNVGEPMCLTGMRALIGSVGPCVPFGSEHCSSAESARRQRLPGMGRRSVGALARTFCGGHGVHLCRSRRLLGRGRLVGTRNQPSRHAHSAFVDAGVVFRSGTSSFKVFKRQRLRRMLTILLP